MQHISSPFKYSIIQEPVYHGTNQWFSKFTHSSDIGFHFGTEAAARDRMTKTGMVEFEIEENVKSPEPTFRSDSVKRIYDLLKSKLQNPRKDLADELNRLSDDELDSIYGEFVDAPTTATNSDARPSGFIIKANGELVDTVETEAEAEYMVKQLRKWASKPRRFLIDVQNPIRMPDLGVWGVGDIAKHAHIKKDELSEMFDLGATDRYEWLKNKLKANGYDSIVYTNAVEDKGSDSYIVFDPSQIYEIDKNHLMEAIYYIHTYK